MGNNTIDNSFVTRNASGLYEVRIPNQPTAVFSSENQAIDFAKRKTNNMASNFVKLMDDGTYQVKYGNEPARVFTNQAQAQKYLENLVLNQQNKVPVAQTPIIGKNANGLHEVKLPGMPARVFQNEADAKKYLEKTVNDLKQTSIKKVANGFEVKLPGEPARLFSDEAAAQKFFNKKLGLDALPENIQNVTTTNKPKVKSKGLTAKFKGFMKGKKGKLALAAGVLGLIGAGVALLLNGKDKKDVNNNESQEPNVPINQPENSQTIPGTQEPEQYIVQKGDHFWGLAKERLEKAHKDEPNYKPTDKEILELAEKIMKENEYGYDENHYYSDPMLLPGDTLSIVS